MCGPKDKCFCCIPLTIGIKSLGVLMILELLHHFLIAGARPYKSAVGGIDAIMILCTIATVSGFIWTMCSQKSLTARKFWLFTVWINCVLSILCGLLSLVTVSDGLVPHCEEIAKRGNHIILDNNKQTWLPGWKQSEWRFVDPPYKNTEACAHTFASKMIAMVVPMLIYDLIVKILIVCSVTNWMNASNETAIMNNAANAANPANPNV